jgi:hypothetical protein
MYAFIGAAHFLAKLYQSSRAWFLRPRSSNEFLENARRQSLSSELFLDLGLACSGLKQPRYLNGHRTWTVHFLIQ